jgi:PAS domain S-box-containing protein
MMAGIRILLVDDDDADRALVLRELRPWRAAAEFVEIADGARLATALDGPPAHLVITGDDLGWADGLTVLRLVRERWGGTPVIAYADTGNEQVAVEGIKLGLDDYVVKSGEQFRRLESSVERALRHVDDLRALSAETRRYRSLFERVPVGLYRYDPGGTLIECNQALLDIFGAADVFALRAAGFPRELYVDQADRDRWRAAVADGVATGIEYRIRRLNGDVAWVRHSARLVRSPIGDPMWFEGVIEDVTRSREAQEALIEAESRFRALVENGSDFIMVLDPDGTMRYVSPSVAADLGHSPDGLVGTSVLDLIHPDDAEEIRRLIGRLGEGPDRALILAARFGRMDGPWRSWEGVVTNRLHEPTVGGLILNAHDVTSRLEAHAQRLEAESRYRDVFENVPIGLYRSGPDGTHIDVNPAMVQILGFDTVQDYLASNAHDLYVDPRDRQAWQETIDREGVVRGFEERLRRPDGRVIWVRDSATAVRDETGAVVMYDGNIEDITERRATEDDLRKTLRQLHRLSDDRQRLLGRLVAAQEEERQRLAGDIHDDPIQVMAAAAVRLDMVERAAIGTPAQEALERTAETVQQAINRLRNLVFELRPPALDREGLAAAIRQYMEHLADIEIDVALQNDLPREPAREIRTTAYRIVQEALTNVRKHAGASRVLVELRERDGGMATVVTDDGVGFRAGADPTRPRAGHIGLQSMRERAEALGGWWRIESRPEGGTRMEFWLPDEGGDTE